MLNDYKNLCKQSADLVIDNWEHLSKNELCNLYLENENDELLANAYFSALLYKYWNLIPKFHSLSYNVAEPEDVYGWLVDSISYALHHRRWTESDSGIYKDSAGPDKVINRRMKCARLTYYQFINRKKRKQDFDVLSLDELQETLNDNLEVPEVEINLDTYSLDLLNFVKEIFNQKDYFLAFLIDILINENIFEKVSNANFNIKKVVKIFKRLDIAFCKRFASTYDLNEESVINSLKYFTKNSTKYLTQKIEYYITHLMYDKTFKEIINVN